MSISSLVLDEESVDSKVLVQEKYTKFRNYSLLIAVQRYNIEDIRESYSMKKRPKIFTNAYGQAGGATPPYDHLDPKKRVSFFDDFP